MPAQEPEIRASHFTSTATTTTTTTTAAAAAAPQCSNCEDAAPKASQMMCIPQPDPQHPTSVGHVGIAVEGLAGFWFDIGA